MQSPRPRTSGDVVQRELNRAIASGVSVFQLPAGDIVCPTDLVVLSASNMLIVAAKEGSTLWFEPTGNDGFRAGFRVMNSQNVTVRGITIDHDPLPYIQAEITAIVPAETTGGAPAYHFKLGVRSLGFEALDGRFGPITQPWLWRGTGADRWVKGRVGMPAPGSAKETGTGTWVSSASFPLMPDVQVGDAVTYMLRQAHTYVIGNSSRVTTEDVTVYSSKSLNFYELDGFGAHVYRRVRVTRRDGQLIGSNADCFHSIDVQHGPLIVDSELAYCLDDFFNIHNTIHILLPPGPRRGRGSLSSTTATLINARITDCHSRPAAIAPYDPSNETTASLDQWYGDTSPMTNAVPGSDTLHCQTFNTFKQALGGERVLLRKRHITNPNRTSLKAAAALQQQISRETGVHYAMAWCGVELWEVDLGDLGGWNTTAEPVLMCDVARFGASGAAVINSSFHHTTCNMGRMKASGSRVVGSRFANASSANLEITGLQNWLEGPMLIDNVTVADNSFPGTRNGDSNVHPSRQATNVTVVGNLPRIPPPTPSNVTAFCSSVSLAPCELPFAHAVMAPMKCSADYMHVEPRALRTRETQYLDALYVLAEGNNGSDVAVVGVVYTDADGAPGALLGNTQAVVVPAHAPRGFVRLPFEYPGGLGITAQFLGETIWMGELAGSPGGRLPMVMGNRSARKVTKKRQHDVEGRFGMTPPIPPGPQDLACLGTQPSVQFPACMFAAAEYTSGPREAFGPSSVCAGSTAVFASLRS